MKRKNSITFLTQGALIAALYVALTFLSNLLGISNGIIQIRFSEALCVLPIFTPSAIWGLALGCLLANMLTGCIIWDIVFGSIATLVGALFTHLLRKLPPLALLGPIISNTLIIPFVLKFAYSFDGSLLFFMVAIGIGEVISCGILGYILFKAIKKRNGFKS